MCACVHVCMRACVHAHSLQNDPPSNSTVSHTRYASAVYPLDCVAACICTYVYVYMCIPLWLVRVAACICTYVYVYMCIPLWLVPWLVRVAASGMSTCTSCCTRALLCCSPSVQGREPLAKQWARPSRAQSNGSTEGHGASRQEGVHAHGPMHMHSTTAGGLDCREAHFLTSYFLTSYFLTS